MTPTPSAPTAEMLAQARSDVRAAGHRLADLRIMATRDRATHNEVADAFTEFHDSIDRLAALARSEPPTEGKIQAVATQRQPIVPELPEGWVFNDAQECPDEGDGVWEIGFHNEEDDHFSPIVRVDTGLYYQPQVAEPLARAILARLAAPVASGRDSLLPASQPSEPPTGEPVAKVMTTAEFFAEAERTGLTIHDLLPGIVKRCKELEAEARAPGAVPASGGAR